MEISQELAEYSQDAHSGPPSRLGQRYSEVKFLPEAGNTIVCALDFDDPDHQLILDARAQIMALPQADHFLFTPVSSLHMTVFDGVIETRRADDTWPSGMDQSLPVADVTQAVAARLNSFHPPAGFDVGVKALRPTGLLLGGASQADEAAMRACREALTGPFGFRNTAHDSYRFHMTFGYALKWLSVDVLPVWQAALDAILNDLTQLPKVPLQAPAFCHFADMTAFHPKVTFSA